MRIPAYENIYDLKLRYPVPGAARCQTESRDPKDASTHLIGRAVRRVVREAQCGFVLHLTSFRSQRTNRSRANQRGPDPNDWLCDQLVRDSPSRRTMWLTKSPILLTGEWPGSRGANACRLRMQSLQHHAVEPARERRRILRQFAVEDLRLLQQQKRQIP